MVLWEVNLTSHRINFFREKLFESFGMENQNSAESISNHNKIFEILILNGQIQSKKS